MMDIKKIERQLFGVIKGQVSSLDAQAAIAGALLEIAKDIDAISRVVKERLPAAAPARAGGAIDDEAV